MLALPLLDCISTIKIVQVMLRILYYAWNPLLLRLPVLRIWNRWVDGYLAIIPMNGDIFFHFLISEVSNFCQIIFDFWCWRVWDLTWKGVGLMNAGPCCCIGAVRAVSWDSQFRTGFNKDLGADSRRQITRVAASREKRCCKGTHFTHSEHAERSLNFPNARMKLCALDFPHFQSWNCRGPPPKGVNPCETTFAPNGDFISHQMVIIQWLLAITFHGYMRSYEKICAPP